MKLVPVTVKGIYQTADGLLPKRMARMTPDAAAALDAIRTEIEKRGG